MALMDLISFSRTKLAKLSDAPFQPYLSMMGFGFTVSAGIWLASCISMAAVTLTAAGYVSAFFVHSLLYLMGGFLGAGIYSQFIKEFQYWPLGPSTAEAPAKEGGLGFFSRKKPAPAEVEKPAPSTFSFRPREMWQDIRILLKAYDALLLSEFNRIFREDLFSSEESKTTKLSKRAGFFKRALHIITLKDPKNKNAARANSDLEPQIQCLYRLCEVFRLYSFERLNNQEVSKIGANSNEVIMAARTDLVKYRVNFLPTLKEKGLGEGLVYALYHEWNEPPAIQAFPTPGKK